MLEVEAREVLPARVVSEPGRRPRFRAGAVVRTLGGGGAYARGVVLAADEDRRYRVDYGPGLVSLIREENLEAFDEANPLSEPPRSFAPPVLPFM